MSHNRIAYTEIFRENGYRLTKQRQAILDAICSSGGHATIGEIYFRARKFDRGLDRSTLYRSLEAFIKMGLVICAEDVIGNKMYELAREEPHHHLVCKQCGGDTEIETQLVDEFYRFLEIAHGFSIDMDHLIVSGICPNCSVART